MQNQREAPGAGQGHAAEVEAHIQEGQVTDGTVFSRDSDSRRKEKECRGPVYVSLRKLPSAWRGRGREHSVGHQSCSRRSNRRLAVRTQQMESAELN